MKKTLCELFAGVGGFRIGFERASREWDTVWFSQWEPSSKKQWAHECYVRHFSDIDENTGVDIATVDKRSIPNHNLLVGGFPCQDYSVAHSGSQGITGKKGVLWWQINDILLEKKPSFVLLENVDRLLKSPAGQRGRDFGIMLACFNEAGYSAQWRVINAADYGGGQRRRRIFIFAYKNDTKYSKKMQSVSSNDEITRFGLFPLAFPIKNSGEISSTKLESSNLISISENFTFDLKNAGAMRQGVIFTSAVAPQIKSPTPLSNNLDETTPSENYFIETDSIEKWRYLKGAKKIERTSKSGFSYIFSEGAIAFPDSVDLPARTMLTSEGTLNRSTHVILDPTTGRLRLLTPTEAERVNGFPVGWTDCMPLRNRYFCMGNALVVSLIEKMAAIIGKIFDAEGG